MHIKLKFRLFIVLTTLLLSQPILLLAQNPGGVTGATAWFRADAGITLSGSGVSQWANQVPTVGFGNLTQSVPSSQPTYSTSLWNFNPGITYNGTSHGFFNTVPSMFTIASATENEVFAALKVNSAAAVYFQLNDNGSTTNRVNLETDRVNFLSASANTNISTTNRGIPRILGMSTTATPSNNITTYLSGRVITSRSFTGTGLTSGSTAPGATIRVYVGSFGSSLYLDGDFPELITYNRNLSATERLRVLSYLALKYGLTIDQTTAQNYIATDGTTVYWDATANSAYSNNIAGIGRDNLTALYQKQSVSINSGSQAIISLGTIATTNAGNTGSLIDKQFFVWGDDNGSLLAKTLTNKSNSTRRFARVWRTQNTNSFNQNITVYYPVSAFNNAKPSSVALIYGTTAAALSSGTADLIVQSGTTTIRGASHYIFSVPATELSKLQFFSFASNPVGPGGVIGHTLWLKASDLSYPDGTAINSTNLWTAATGNSAGTYSNGTSPTFKINSWNFNPVVRFTAGGIGADYINTGTSITTITALNVTGSSLVTGGRAARALSLARNSAPDDNNLCMIPLRGTSFSGLETATNGGSVTAGFTAGSILNGNNPGIAISMRTPATNFATGNTGNNLFAQWSGYAFASGTSFASLSAYNIDYYALGGQATGTKAIGTPGLLEGDIPEVAIYDVDLSETERRQINSYLAIKYGVTLDYAAFSIDYLASDGTTVIWPSNANATYRYNIAGVGRDDGSSLNQKQSRSVNSGDQLVVSLGAAQATNEGNTSTFAADKQYLIWGDNDGSLTAKNDFLIPKPSGASISKRIGRIWKMRNTNSFNQSVTVYFPTAVLSSAFGTASPYVVYSDQANFTGSIRQVAARTGTQVINGINYTAFTFTVPSSADLFLTFAGYYIQTLVNPANTSGLQNGRIKY